MSSANVSQKKMNLTTFTNNSKFYFDKYTQIVFQMAGGRFEFLFLRKKSCDFIACVLSTNIWLKKFIQIINGLYNYMKKKVLVAIYFILHFHFRTLKFRRLYRQNKEIAIYLP